MSGIDKIRQVGQKQMFLLRIRGIANHRKFTGKSKKNQKNLQIILSNIKAKV
jgi:hypothetical protein